jgi:nitrate/nitrite-specific signal transduction histidine kinase
MYELLIFTVWGIFAAILFLNVYFRVKVFKVYKNLVQNRVQFNALDTFNKEKMAEVKKQYPNNAKDIDTFVSHIQFSTKMASLLVLLITIFGGILMYFRFDD